LQFVLRWRDGLGQELENVLARYAASRTFGSDGLCRRFQIVGQALVDAARSRPSSVMPLYSISAAITAQPTSPSASSPARSEASLNVRIEPLAQLAGGFQCVAAARLARSGATRRGCAPSFSTKATIGNVSLWTHLSLGQFSTRPERYAASEVASQCSVDCDSSHFTAQTPQAGYERQRYAAGIALFGGAKGRTEASI
jgi:hypothetical protein